MAKTGRLEGKVAIITGGASGIGAASVRRFCAEGAKVAIGDVNEADAAAVLAAVKAAGGEAFYRHADVSDEPQVEALCDAAIDRWGRLDVIFNNAGIAGIPQPLIDCDVTAWDLTLAINLRGVFLGIKHAARRMLERSIQGSILSTASVAGLGGGRGPAPYTAAKAGVINLTRQAAIELSPRGIRVNCIAPGGIVTPIFTRVVPEQIIEPVLAQAQPIPRAGRPDDIANAALFLASDESSFVSGECLVVDGALTTGSIRPLLSSDQLTSFVEQLQRSAK